MTQEDSTDTEISPSERDRALLFLGIQVGFLAVSPLARGFDMQVWSMLDSPILVFLIGITGLVFVLDELAIRITRTGWVLETRG